jgi:hypothetical protein
MAGAIPLSAMRRFGGAVPLSARGVQDDGVVVRNAGDGFNSARANAVFAMRHRRALRRARERNARRARERAERAERVIRGGHQPAVLGRFQQVRLEFQNRIDDRKFEFDQALDRRDEILAVIPPSPEDVAEDAESMARTIQGIRDRNAETDEDRKPVPGEIEDAMPPPVLDTGGYIAELSGRMGALEAGVFGLTHIQDLATTGASIAERGYNIGKGTVGAANYSASMGGSNATGTFDLDVLDAEMNSDIIAVDLANNKIIVKKGFSGVYNVSMLLEAEINLPSSGAGTGQAKVAVKNDGVSAFEWSFLISSNSAATSATYHEHSSGASKMIYVDASAADVDFTADWSVATVAGGPQVIRLKQLSVELLQLAKSATEI